MNKKAYCRFLFFLNKIYVYVVDVLRRQGKYE